MKEWKLKKKKNRNWMHSFTTKTTNVLLVQTKHVEITIVRTDFHFYSKQKKLALFEYFLILEVRFSLFIL